MTAVRPCEQSRAWGWWDSMRTPHMTPCTHLYTYKHISLQWFGAPARRAVLTRLAVVLWRRGYQAMGVLSKHVILFVWQSLWDSVRTLHAAYVRLG